MKIIIWKNNRKRFEKYRSRLLSIGFGANERISTAKSHWLKVNPSSAIALQLGGSFTPKFWLTFARKRAFFRFSITRGRWNISLLGLELSFKKSFFKSPFSCIPATGFYFPENSDVSNGKSHSRKNRMADLSCASSADENETASMDSTTGLAMASAALATDATKRDLHFKPIAIATSDYHSLVLRQDGTVVAWGNNDFGQVSIPANLHNVAAIAAGAYHSLAIHNDGVLVAWGSNTYGQLSIPTNLGKVQAIAAGKAHSLALRTDGTVVAWGGNFNTQKNTTPELKDVIEIAAGGFHNLALRSNGTVFAWGNKTYRQTTMPSDLSNIVAIAAGTNHSLALNSQGELFAWGNNTYGQNIIPANLRNVVAIASGAHHNLALCSDGTVVAWGYNAFGQTTIPSNLRNVVAICAGSYHSMVLCSDGSVVAWGLDTDEQVSVPASVYLAARQVARIKSRSDYTLTYKAGANGTLVGVTSQSVQYGASGTLVAAVPDANYQFVNWSDGSTENPRIDRNVVIDRIITANFALVHDESLLRSTNAATNLEDADMMNLSINFIGATISFRSKDIAV